MPTDVIAPAFIVQVGEMIKKTLSNIGDA